MPNREEIIKRLVANLDEVITPDEFADRLSGEEALTHYIGFEISGYVHIGQGITSALVIKDLQELGVKCTIWLADWHTAINEKLDGEKATAAQIGKGYFTEAVRACLFAVGADPDRVEFRLASEWYAKEPMRYVETLLSVQRHVTVARLLRSIDIMGREAGENVEAAKLMYPAMQVADVLYQGIDIAHASMDQRKAHVVLRDVFNKIYPGQAKPVAIHHALIDGLDGEQKMSKSRPDAAVFIHDAPAEIERKIKKAFCPAQETLKNPVLNWTKYLLFWNRTEPLRIIRKPEHGGIVEFANYPALEKAYAAGEVHPMDLKAMVAQELITLLEPVRQHFEKPDIAAKKAELDKILEKR